MKPGCPYAGLPRSAYWRTAVGAADRGALVPQVGGAELFGPRTRIASAGSCFAQNMARELKAAGFAYFETESGPAWFDEQSRATMGYGLYSARFGNVYTAAQLRQLLERCLGESDFAEPAWQEGGRFHDPFRPTVQPGGFASLDALEEDRARHLAAVRTLFEQLEVFVFTLGLTEGWRSRTTGAVFPICPGCEVGTFDASLHEFVNFPVSAVVADLDAFLARFRALNPAAQVVLTVSPVPLAATYAGRHVLEATTYSKSVLRVAAEEARLRHDNVHYFASYEIVTGLGRPDYFEADRRGVAPEAVAHVMDAFFSLYANEEGRRLASERRVSPSAAPLVCDEDALAEAQAVRVS